MAIYDVSEYQGVIDMVKLKATADGLIIRVQAGSTHEDKNHKTYEADADKNAIPYGEYAYFRGISYSDAEKEATDFLARASKNARFLVIDAEAVSMVDMKGGVQHFINYIKAHDSRPIGLYSGEYFFNTYLQGVTDYDFLWIAKYNSNDGQIGAKPSVPCDLWQYTSNIKIDEIPQNTVDVSIINGSKPLSYFFGEKTVVQAVAPKPQPVAPKETVYTVVSGDNVTHIAKKYGVTVDAIVQANNLKNGGNLITIGEKLIIPSANTPKPSAPQPVYHKVVSGDTVSELALKYGSTVSEIISWNKLNAKATIIIGENIRVK